ncbi:FadR/GntR family transcriptional regulator [Chloroflexota bacterium]
MSESRQQQFQAVRHTRLSEEIGRQVENLILSNELRIGDTLPPERELAAQLGVSRNILREAISMLVQKGLLEVRPGSGTYVARPSAEFLSDSLSLFLRFNASAFFDLVEARRALEVQAADLAAQRATKEDCRLIAACLKDMEAAVGEPETYTEADVCFHAAVASAGRNEILRLLLDSIREALRENIRFLLEHHPSAVDDAMRSHRRIAQAVQQHSPEDARAAMREHLDNVRQGLEELREDNGSLTGNATATNEKG